MSFPLCDVMARSTPHPLPFRSHSSLSITSLDEGQSSVPLASRKNESAHANYAHPLPPSLWTIPYLWSMNLVLNRLLVYICSSSTVFSEPIASDTTTTSFPFPPRHCLPPEHDHLLHRIMLPAFPASYFNGLYYTAKRAVTPAEIPFGS